MLRVRIGKVLEKHDTGRTLTLIVGPPPDGDALHFRPDQFLTDNPNGFIVQVFSDDTVQVTDEAVPRDLDDHGGHIRPFRRGA